MYSSSVNAKGQVTIPAAIRKHLGIKQDDKIAFRIEGSKAVLQKADSVDRIYLHIIEVSLAEEWLSPEDCAAYDHL